MHEQCRSGLAGPAEADDQRPLHPVETDAHQPSPSLATSGISMLLTLS
jgi:hypothetical protein